MRGGGPQLGAAPTCPGADGHSTSPIKARLAPTHVLPEDEAAALLGDALEETGRGARKGSPCTRALHWPWPPPSPELPWHQGLQRTPGSLTPRCPPPRLGLEISG